MGIGHHPKAASLLHSPYLIGEWDLPSSLVLLTGDGHWWIALDYRADDREPSVGWFDAELGTELRLARSFAAFVEGLTRTPADC